MSLSRATRWKRTDFLPFKLLSDLPWAMTGHLLFEAIDPAQAITVSAGALQDVIRGFIGFDGLLSDDLSMQALGGALGERAARSIAAGCDMALPPLPDGRDGAGGQPARPAMTASRGGVSTPAARRSRQAWAPMPQARLADRRLASLLPEWG